MQAHEVTELSSLLEAAGLFGFTAESEVPTVFSFQMVMTVNLSEVGHAEVLLCVSVPPPQVPNRRMKQPWSIKCLFGSCYVTLAGSLSPLCIETRVLYKAICWVSLLCHLVTGTRQALWDRFAARGALVVRCFGPIVRCGGGCPDFR